MAERCGRPALAGRTGSSWSPPLQAKGLEYDGVLVVDPGRDRGRVPRRRTALYVALTRPTQRLVTLDAVRPG